MKGFRVYDTVEKKYAMPEDFYIDCEGDLHFMKQGVECDILCIASDRYIVEEGTTVEGKQFFVGDVCEDDPDEPKLEIGWCDITAKFTITQDNVEYGFDNYNVDDLEVIGTIHDNPELLEVTE